MWVCVTVFQMPGTAVTDRGACAESCGFFYANDTRCLVDCAEERCGGTARVSVTNDVVSEDAVNTRGAGEGSGRVSLTPWATVVDDPSECRLLGRESRGSRIEVFSSPRGVGSFRQSFVCRGMC